MQPLINARCFLTGLEGPCQGLIIIDPETGAQDKIHVGVETYATVCGGSDQLAGQMWKGIKAVRSAGYTESSFAHALVRDAAKFDMEAYLIAWRGNEYLGLAKAATMGYTLICRSARPIWLALGDALGKAAPAMDVGSGQRWLHDRFVFGRTDIGFVLETNMALAESLYASSLPLLGEMDLMLHLAHLQTNTGYELIRRKLL